MEPILAACKDDLEHAERPDSPGATVIQQHDTVVNNTLKRDISVFPADPEVDPMPPLTRLSPSTIL